jgi:hypothetical protein
MLKKQNPNRRFDLQFNEIMLTKPLPAMIYRPAAGNRKQMHGTMARTR